MAEDTSKKPIYKCRKCGELCINNVMRHPRMDTSSARIGCWSTLKHTGCGGEVVDVTKEVEEHKGSPITDSYD